MIAVHGKQEMIKFNVGLGTRDPDPLHIVSLSNIRQNGDIATVRYFTICPVIGDVVGPMDVGRYTADVLKEADGKWRILN